MRRGPVRLVAPLALLALLAPAAPASAKIAAKAAVEDAAGGARLVVRLTSTKRPAARARPRAVSVLAGGRTYRLTRTKGAAAVALGTWRSAVQRGAAATRLRALVARRVTVRVSSRAGRTTVRPLVAGPGGGGTTPAPGPGGGGTTPAPGPGGTSPLFAAPGVDRTGNEAYEAIEAYLADTRFTDCPAGWPTCGTQEIRYAHFADGRQYYCRLTNVSGADITSVGTVTEIVGAEQKADGSWAVSYALSSYGSTTYYTWRVSAQGVVTGQYWGPGVDPQTSAPTETIGPLQWVRGAKDCSY